MDQNDPLRDKNFSYITKVGCISRFRRTIRTMDMYARPITLRYKEEKKFRTNFGACSSLLVFLSISMLLWNGIGDMLKNEDINQTITYKVITSKPQELEQRGGDFMFGYRFVNFDGSQFEDESVVYAEMKTIVKEWNEENQAYSTKDDTYFEGPCYDKAVEIA